MKFKGRGIDPLSFWSRYVDFPANLKIDGPFLPLVQCPNPDHPTMKRHFQINVEQPTVHCFTYCGISGSYSHAVAMIEGLYEKFKVEEATSERERKIRVARAHRAADRIILRNSRTGSITVPKKRQSGDIRIGKPKSFQYDTYLPPVAREYLTGRGISADSISLWGLGWDAEQKRIVIPVKDEHGRVRLLIRRAIDSRDGPTKYLYSEDVDKTSLLFGACHIDLEMLRSDGVVLVEGALDAIRLRQHGIQAVATLGTGISNRQAAILDRLMVRRVYLMMDRDAAGVHGIEIAERKLRTTALFICRYPRGRHDPAELTRKEAHRSIAKARPLSLWKLDVARMSTKK